LHCLELYKKEMMIELKMPLITFQEETGMAVG
jgi:hypothetical protein